jgi:lipoprotein-anchoring transpeptidase ErfK/SrfK
MPESLHTIFKKMELKFMVRRIDVSTSQHQLKLFEGNRLIKSYPIAVGKILSPSPSGTYTIINKQHNPGGPFGVLWMGLSRPHYGIHGTNNPASIGRNVSHGCIRMFNLDVIDLSNRVSIGTRVFIHK